MQYRSVPKTGEQISALGFGAMRLPTKRGKIDKEKAIALIRSAIDNGINYIDTAYLYHGGASETVVGKALKDGYRERVFIATKLPPWLVFAQKDMETIFNVQLTRLEVSTIDYYLLHSLDATSWKKFLDLGAPAYLDELKALGKIKYAGFSFHGDIVTFKNIIDSYNWDFCQIQINILDEQFQAGVEGMRYAHDQGIAVFAMEPLRGGMLVNAPKSVLEAYAEVQPTWTPVEWALRHLWNYKEITMLLSGMGEEVQLTENVKIAKTALPGSLTQKEKDAITKVQNIYRKEIKVECTGCGYCMPCPCGVNIQQCFTLYNSKYMYNGHEYIMYVIQLDGVMGIESRAGLCTKCGACIQKCPQHLQIPDLLSDVKAEFEGPIKYGLVAPIVKSLYSMYAWTKQK
jgi:predicted aldo/keto reductase-like oxidoreductase